MPSILLISESRLRKYLDFLDPFVLIVFRRTTWHFHPFDLRSFIPLQHVYKPLDMIDHLISPCIRLLVFYQIKCERHTSSTSSVSCIIRTTSYTPLLRKFSRPARVVHSNRSVWTWVERRTGSRSRTFVEGRNWSSGKRRSTSYNHHRWTFVNERTEQRSGRTSSSYSSGPARGSRIRGRTFNPNAGRFECGTGMRSFSEPSIAGWPSTVKAQFLHRDRCQLVLELGPTRRQDCLTLL